MQKELETNIKSLELKIAKVSKTVSKNLDDIFLIAVSKKKSIEHIKTAQDSGINNFGENYAQELEDKANNIGRNISWHFIGPLQSNKANIVAKYADWIHTIDRKKIAYKMNEECKKINKIINACIQVNISNEPTKSGINPEKLLVFAKYVDSMENINLKGIMVLPSLGENNKKQMHDSKLLHKELISVFPHAEYLSMGTTNDFETAIISGSNMIRVGELIFGERQ
jgi:pyridoxal phosphate enzyme (YggS family)